MFRNDILPSKFSIMETHLTYEIPIWTKPYFEIIQNYQG